MLHPVHKKLAGFTIVEIIVVVVVLGILIGIGTVSWNGAKTRAFNALVQSDIHTYKDTFELYGSQTGNYPPVPRPGSYCLGTGGMPGEIINTKSWPGTPLPTSFTVDGATEVAYYCRDLKNSSSRHSSHPTLSKALSTVATINKSASESHLADEDIGGVYAHYQQIDPLKVRIQIFGVVRGDTCPDDLLQESSTETTALCYVELARERPVEFTYATWPYAG